MMIDVGSAVARCPQDRPCSRWTRQTQSGDSVGFPGRRICRSSFQFLLVKQRCLSFLIFLSNYLADNAKYFLICSQYCRAVRGLQIRHPHPEDRQLLQSLHVNESFFLRSIVVIDSFDSQGVWTKFRVVRYDRVSPKS